MNDSPARERLAALAHDLADPALDLVLAGEGNVSIPTGRGTILVTPSGARLAQVAPEELVEVSVDGLVADLDSPRPDHEWLELILGSRVDKTAARPTVEVALHAVIASLAGDVVIAHTHPTDLLVLLCSGRARDFARTRLIPDHVVMLGVEDAVVPYVDPGRELAVAVRDVLVSHRETHGVLPALVLVENHGIFVIGSTPREALDRTLMACKFARVFAAGGDIGLGPSSVARIAGREDEHFRRSLLAD